MLNRSTYHSRILSKATYRAFDTQYWSLIRFGLLSYLLSVKVLVIGLPWEAGPQRRESEAFGVNCMQFMPASALWNNHALSESTIAPPIAGETETISRQSNPSCVRVGGTCDGWQASLIPNVGSADVGK